MIGKISAPMNLRSCVGLGETIAVNVRSGFQSEHDELDPYAGKDFFDDENFQAALERLNGGYEMAQDLIRMMEDYCEIDRTRAQTLLLFSKKWTKHFQNQSRISSYHTTQRTQLDTIRIAKHLARIDNNRCDALKAVINNYRTLVDETYVRVNFGCHFEHCRFREFKKLFKHAHAFVAESKKNLDKLRDRLRRAEQALLNANRAVEKVIHDETSSEIKRLSKSDAQTECETEMKRLQEKVVHAEQTLENTKQIYHVVARATKANNEQSKPFVNLEDN
ncbi:unnamed protein product [Rotaria sp. Silwood1]|nr:unnamed protein product [Rotaria sp. Silwood1]CAF4600478.1 unnamed protein product [Rotaria sp. Silwood1]CAF4638383.1 unnamed protein product [Rotaria sp. Silwood1]CAF4878735.1 unnamed protein product [Rotaria sp. Silwood1]